MRRFLFVAIFALAIPLQGCDALFDRVEPRESISSELALTDIDGFEALLVSVYDRLQRAARYGQLFMLYPDALADNITHTTPHSNRYPAPVNNQIGTHMNEWTFPYFAINEANYIIAWIDDLNPNEVPRPNPERLIRSIKGQAYALRALNHFDLLRTKAYEPGMEVDGWTAGVIIRTEPVDRVEQADFRARAPAAAVYAQIEQDLIEATNLLNDITDAENEWITGPAAWALLARVYLYQRKWEQAAEAATNALNFTTRSLVQDTGNGQYAASWATQFHSEAIFELRMTPGRDGDATSVNGALNALTWGQCEAPENNCQGEQAFSFEAIPTNDLLEAHEEGDARLDLYAEGAKPRPVGAPVPVMYSQKWRANVPGGPNTSHIPLVRVSELYLTRAEARAEMGNAAGARDDLNTVRHARGLGDIDAGLSGAALVDAILRDRRVEFAFEGHRFFDLKRRGMDIPKPQAATGTIPYSDFRVLAPLPSGEVIANPLLVQNPGY